MRSPIYWAALAAFLATPAAAFNGGYPVLVPSVSVTDRLGLFTCFSNSPQVSDMVLPSCKTDPTDDGGGSTQCTLVVTRTTGTDVYNLAGSLRESKRPIALSSAPIEPFGYQGVWCQINERPGLAVGNIKVKGHQFYADVIRTDLPDGKPHYYRGVATFKLLK